MGDQSIMKETSTDQVMRLSQIHRQMQTKVTIAAQLCAMVLLNGKAAGGRFALTVDDLATMLGLPPDRVHAVILDASERHLVRSVAASVVLQAAGIYLAKETLGLPR